MNKKRGRGIIKILVAIAIRLGLFVLGVLGIVIVTVVVLILRYKQWESEKSDFLNNITEQEYSDESISEVDELLSEFQASKVERENLRLSRDEIEVIIYESIEENDGERVIEGIEVVTLNRSFDLYVKLEGLPWFIIRGWQRQEGSVDFVIYDVMLGPLSLSTLTWGWASGQFSSGMQDALDIVLSENFSGRRIEEIYVFENGVRIVGGLDVEEEK